MATLAELVQSLLRELYDEVYNLTFTTTSNAVHVSKDYRPPSLLQVSQQSRATFTNSYYGGRSSFCVDRAILPRWLNSLDGAALRLLGDIKVVQETLIGKLLDVYTLYECLEGGFADIDMSLDDKTQILGNQHKRLGAIVKFKVSYAATQGDEEECMWLSYEDVLQDIFLQHPHMRTTDANSWCASRADALQKRLGSH